jgi:hypothetical protein
LAVEVEGAVELRFLIILLFRPTARIGAFEALDIGSNPIGVTKEWLQQITNINF